MIQSIVELILLTLTALAFVVVVLAAIYDMKRVQAEKLVAVVTRHLSKPHQPHVTILLMQSAELATTLASLRRLRKIQYRKYDVVLIAPQCSLAGRRRLIESAKVESLAVYAPRTRELDELAIRRAYQRSRRGELLLIVRDTDVLQPGSVKQSVALIQQHGSVDGVRLVGAVATPDSLLGLYRIFIELSQSVVAKVLVLLHIPRSRASRQTGLYNTSRYMRAVTRSSRLRMIDRRGLAGVGNAQDSARKHIGWVEWMTRLLSIVFVAYCAAMAALLQSSFPLILTWTLVSIWLLAIIWSGDIERFTGKLALSVCVPIGMFVIAAMYVISIPSVVLRHKAF